MHLSIVTKLALSFALIIATFSGLFIFGMTRSRTLNEQLQALNRTIVPMSLLLADAQHDLKSFDTALDTRTPTARREVTERPRHCLSKLERAHRMSTPARLGALRKDERMRMARLHSRLDVLITRASDLARQAGQLQRPTAPTAPEHATPSPRHEELREVARRLDTTLSRMRNDLRVSSELALMRANDSERANLYALILSSLAALALATLATLIALSTVRPLTRLGEAARRVAGGDYRPIEAPGRRVLSTDDEIATLTREFNSMALALDARDAALRDQHAALLRSERLATVGRMTSLITHELRNPLSSIGLNAEMLMDALLDPLDPGDPDALNEHIVHLETIIHEVDRLRDITEEYLGYARMPTPRKEQEDLVDLLEQLVDFHAFEWAQQGVEIQLDLSTLPEPGAPALVDANQLRQALLNLIRNGVEASPPDSTLDVQMTRDATHTTISIRDHGDGVPEERRERIFEPFFTSRERGTGLGLAVTQQIVEEHHGTITLEHPPGGGACFLVRLPHAQEP